MNIEVNSTTDCVTHACIKLTSDITGKCFSYGDGIETAKVTVWVDENNIPVRVDIYGM